MDWQTIIKTKRSLLIRVKPGARLTSVSGQLTDGRWKINIKAKAEAGKANNELINFLAKELLWPKDKIKIIGATGHDKLIRLYE